jgi:hypothetical protein
MSHKYSSGASASYSRPSAAQNAARTALAPQAFGSMTPQYQRSRSAGRGLCCAGLPASTPCPRNSSWIAATATAVLARDLGQARR